MELQHIGTESKTGYLNVAQHCYVKLRNKKIQSLLILKLENCQIRVEYTLI